MSEVALDFAAEAFTLHSRSPMGRQAAGESFLGGYVRHGGARRFIGFGADDAEAGAFAEAIHRRQPRAETAWASPRDLGPVVEAGTLFCYHPLLGSHAWRRRRGGEARYSLCGLTHTMSSQAAMSAAAELVSAPIHPWDALICPSRAIRDATRRLVDRQRDYAAARFGGGVGPEPYLPVIPLGVDADAFVMPPAQRRRWRRRLGIEGADLAGVYVGRLSAHAKANPLPMMIALERAAVSVADGGRLHMIFAGWFNDDFQKRIFTESAARLAPSVRFHWLDGRRADEREGAWAAADLFLQLADNVQESFGLAPVEAMAAGLPVVVSDWDGFRDTVEHGVQGFRVPTVQPPAGYAIDIANAHDEELISYDHMIGAVSQFVAVDIAGAGEALARLVGDAALRAEMGAAGRARVLGHFDWSRIIPAYEALWAELAERRAMAPEAMRRAGEPRPDRPDPFDVFAGFATRRLAASDVIALAPGGDPAVLGLTGAALVPEVCPSPDEVATVLAMLTEGPVALARLIAPFQGPRHVHAVRGVTWLAKLGLVTITPGA